MSDSRRCAISAIAVLFLGCTSETPPPPNGSAVSKVSPDRATAAPLTDTPTATAQPERTADVTPQPEAGKPATPATHSSEESGDAPHTDAPADALRTWTDVTGQHRTEAEFLSLTGTQVQLRKMDGSIVTVPMEKLSREDRAYAQRKSAPSITLGTSSPSPTSADNQGRDAAVDDKQRLQGEWLVTENTKDRSGIGNVHTFHGDAVDIFLNQLGVTFKFKYRLDPTKAPKQIDQLDASGKLSSMGIYSIEGDKLTMCWNPFKRPQKLAASDFDDIFMVFERIKARK